MKIVSIIVCTACLAVCGCSHPKPTMTNRQVLDLVVKELPQAKSGDSFSTEFKDGAWQVFLLKDAFSTNVGHAVIVATVRDSDGKVEFVKKP